ncbi:M48 family metallopeptidase [soil metagenome]
MSTLSTWRAAAVDPGEFFSAEELATARRYQRPVAFLRVFRSVLALAVLGAFVAGQAGPELVDALGVNGWVLRLLVVMVALEACTLVYDPVLDAWVDLVHDRRWGLSTQSGPGLVVDAAKSLVLGLVLNTVLLVPLYALIRATDLWWLFGWLLVAGSSLRSGFLYPIVIAPLFNTFTPLVPGELADRIARVAEQAGVDISGAYVADASRRSRRDNAYVAGFGSTRRVVLFDTLLEHPPEIVEQVVAHEIGHWRRRHLRLQVPLSAVLALVVFGALKLLSEWDGLLSFAGVGSFGDPASLPLLLIGAAVGFGVTGLVGSWVSRAFERQADLDALELLRRPDLMAAMQRRLHTKNLADLDPGPLKRLRASHPPAAERMAFTRRWQEANGVVASVPSAPG